MRDRLVLFINGQRYKIAYEDAILTLAEFLRRHVGLVGTKVVCNEGDCGACTVLLGRPSKDATQMLYQTVDSCILFLFQLDCSHVVTVEGLCGAGKGEMDGELTPIQDAMVHCHGSQCGFCTPGFVVAMHGMVEAGAQLDEESLRYGLSGNLCRCTGYQQILDAGRSVDLQSVRRIGDRYPDQPMLQELAGLGSDPVCVMGPRTVLIPRTIKQAIEFRADYPAATIVNGATDVGVLHNHGRAVQSDVLCLTNIAGFDLVATENEVLRIGGGATWTQIERQIAEIFPQYHAIVTRFGGPQTRNTGTLAGNLATGSPIADSIPFHLVMDSRLRLVSMRGERTIGLNDFYTGYRQHVMEDDELIGEITTPLLAASERLALYKISKRRDMDISTLTFGLWVRIVDHAIEAARLAIGGVGPMVRRIADSEQHMIGKPFSASTFAHAGRIARQQITPWSDVRGGADYRAQLAENLMRKAYHEFAKDP